MRRRSEIERLCRQFRVRRLGLFDSAATGGFRPGESDLDLLVEFEPLPAGTYADTYFGLLDLNILIHGYANVDDKLVWDVAETKLPVLRREADVLLNEP